METFKRCKFFKVPCSLAGIFPDTYHIHAKVADLSTCQRVGFEPANGRVIGMALVFTDTFLPGMAILYRPIHMIRRAVAQYRSQKMDLTGVF